VRVDAHSCRQSQEGWNEYFLDDGSVVRIKLVLTDTFRVSGVFDMGWNPMDPLCWNAVSSVSSQG
jgi:hypothetical protein